MEENVYISDSDGEIEGFEEADDINGIDWWNFVHILNFYSEYIKNWNITDNI